MNSEKIVSKWINSPRLTKQEKKEIEKMTSEQKQSFFSNKSLTFGTAGIRANMGMGTNQFNRFVYSQLTEAYCKWLLEQNPNPKIMIARDNRKNGSHFQQVCAEVASAFGVKVYLIGQDRIKSTPIVSFLIKEMKLDGAIIITASHNPKNYNGFKIYKQSGGQLVDKETKAIQKMMPKSETIIDNIYKPDKKLIKEVLVEKENKYFKAAQKALIKTKVNEQKTFPIIFTPHHGTAVNTMVEWLNSLGYRNVITVKEQDFIDENFSNSPMPNPEEKKSFNQALKYALKHDAGIMLAVDPDADRLAIVVKHKNKWHYLSGNEAGTIFTEYVLMNKKFKKAPMVVSTHVSTNLVEKICKINKVAYFRTGTGFKWLADKMNQELEKHDLVVAFEEAIGSLNSTINSDKDSYQAAGLILEIFNECKKQQLTLIDYLENIYKKYSYWSGDTIYFQMDITKVLDWKEKMLKKMEFFKNHKPIDLGNEKFIKAKWNNQGDCLEWHYSNYNTIKFRMSGTEPKFKVYINSFGKTKKESMIFLNAAIEYTTKLYEKN